jgi:hypothetical protein
MKKILFLISSIATCSISFAQFEQTNEPSIGDESTLFVIDSLAPDFATETGSGATWDYSSYGGFDNDSRTLQVVDPSTTANASDFPSSEKALEIEGFLSSFFSSSATERSYQGFVYSDPGLGDILAQFSTDEAIQYEYPFDLADLLTDTYEGTVDVPPFAIGSALTGSLSATVDADGGTLDLANGVQFTNVTRYKIEETSEVTTGLGTFVLDRIQYEYYDLSTSNLPVFVHTSVSLSQFGTTVTDFSLVLSAEDPENFVSVNEQINAVSEISIFPNPATDEVNFKLPQNLSSASFSIIDAVGRQVETGKLDAVLNQVDVSSLKNGVYLVRFSNGAAAVTRQLIIR